MSIRPLKTLVLAITCLPLLACSTNRQLTSPHEPLHTTNWQTNLPGEKGSVTILFSLPTQANAQFELLSSNSKNKTSNTIAAYISLSNQNCISGHTTAVNYFNNSAVLSRYFKQETPWNNTNSITLTWDKQQLSTTVNDESISVSSERKIKILRITSTAAPIYIQQVQYTTITK